MKNRGYRISVCLFAAMLFFQMTACGTLLYPERRGQKTGRIDVGVAVLDGIGLLFFVVPGIVAFAVDFATGAIFLPPGQSNSKVFASKEAPAVYISLDDLNQDNIERVILEQTGKAIDLDSPDLVVLKLSHPQELPRQYAEWRSSFENALSVAALKD